MPMMKIENVLQPGKTYSVDADKFEAMRKAYLAHVPTGGIGATPAEIQKALLPALPQDLFPGGAKPDGGRKRCSWIKRRKASSAAAQQHPFG